MIFYLFTKHQFRCETDHIGNYYCDCDAGWDGKDCGTMLETDCSDGIDNDKGA